MMVQKKGDKSWTKVLKKKGGGIQSSVQVLTLDESESVICSVVSNSLQPGSSVHGILQARILEWVTTSFSRESS